ncbi:MAG: hypothetical protein KY475_27265 [Planctomycetes bacterium]|nr:hypothetical protein [Planctomycetota bacterium]
MSASPPPTSGPPAPKGAEGEVAVRLATDVQPLGICKDVGIAVGGREAREEHLAAADRPAVDLGVLTGVVGLADLGGDT